MKTVFIENKEEIEAIINGCDVCYVGINDTDSAPYVIPMNFGYENDEIYLHSAPVGKHLALIEKDPNVCVTFCSAHKLVYQHVKVACSYRMDAGSVLCKGQVVFIEDKEEKCKALNVIMKNYSDRKFEYSLPAVLNVKIWKIKIVEISAKSFGQKS